MKAFTIFENGACNSDPSTSTDFRDNNKCAYTNNAIISYNRKDCNQTLSEERHLPNKQQQQKRIVDRDNPREISCRTTCFHYGCCYSNVFTYNLHKLLYFALATVVANNLIVNSECAIEDAYRLFDPRDRLLPINDLNYDRRLYALSVPHRTQRAWRTRQRQFRRHLQQKRGCDASNFDERSAAYRKQNDAESGSMSKNYYIFVLTEDCQFLFARTDQIDQLSAFSKIDRRFTHCRPDQVQLHWREWSDDDGGAAPRIALQLFIKRSKRQICTLPIEVPDVRSIIGGARLFSYSLRASLNYAVCSFMPNVTFVLEPGLSFMDSTYSDIVYFVDPNAYGAFWTVRQFQLSADGYLRILDTFEVKNIAESADSRRVKASEYLIGLDAKRRHLYVVDRMLRRQQQTQKRKAFSTCPFDLLFRPHRARIADIELRTADDDARRRTLSAQEHRITSFSADHATLAFAEETQHGNGPDATFTTKLFFLSTRQNGSEESIAQCALELPYRATFGFISGASLDQLEKTPLPRFSAIRHFRLDSLRHHLPDHLFPTSSAAAVAEQTPERQVIKPSEKSSVKSVEKATVVDHNGDDMVEGGSGSGLRPSVDSVMSTDDYDGRASSLSDGYGGEEEDEDVDLGIMEDHPLVPDDWKAHSLADNGRGAATTLAGPRTHGLTESTKKKVPGIPSQNLSSFSSGSSAIVPWKNLPQILFFGFVFSVFA